MDDRLKDFLDALENLKEALDEDVDLYRSAQRARDKAQKEAEQAAKELRDKQIAAVSKVAGVMGNLASSFSQGEGSFNSLTTATKMVATGLGNLASMIPIFGGALKGLIDAAGESATFLIQMYEKMYSDYEKLSKVGMVTTTTDFVNSMKKAQLTLSMTNQVLGKFSKELAYTGSRLANTEYSFDLLAETSVDARKELQRLGIGAVEFNEIQIGYIDRLARTGQLEGKSRADLIKGTKEYTLEIDKIAKLTGLNREEIQKERDARLRDARFRAGIATLDVKAQESINGFLDQLKGLGPEMAETTQGLQDLIASGGVPTTEAGRQALLALQQGGVDIQAFVDGMRSGSVTQTQAFDMMTAAAKRAEPQFRELASVIGTETDVTKQYVGLATLANAGLKSREELEAEAIKRQQEALKGTDEQNASLADTRQSLIRTQSNLESLALSSDTVSKAMKNLSGGIDKVVAKINSMFGGTESAPPAPPAPPAGRPSGTGPATARPSQPGSPVIPGREQRVIEPGPEILKLRDRILGEFPNARQTSLSSARPNNPDSKHPQGMAFDFVLTPDIYTAGTDPNWAQNVESVKKTVLAMGASSFRDEYNLSSPDKTGPHFHVEVPKYGNGGTVDEPTVALVGERGPEAVVPLSGGRSIPVQFGDEFGKKLDALISLAERQNSMLSNVFDRLT